LVVSRDFDLLMDAWLEVGTSFSALVFFKMTW
jgi:hypothetical protein